MQGRARVRQYMTSYNKSVIAWASLVPHVGYWHGSDVEPMHAIPNFGNAHKTCTPCLLFYYNEALIIVLVQKGSMKSCMHLPLSSNQVSDTVVVTSIILQGLL